MNVDVGNNCMGLMDVCALPAGKISQYFFKRSASDFDVKLHALANRQVFLGQIV